MVVIRVVAEGFSGFGVVMLHQIGALQIPIPEVLDAVLPQESAELPVINMPSPFALPRGGIQGDPEGQKEAGLVLGMTKTQIFYHVTLLQMIKRIVPPMSNEIITLVKDTSLARIIALQEVIWAGQAFMKGSQGISGAIWPLFFTAVYYLIFNGILTVLLGRLEKKLDYFK